MWPFSSRRKEREVERVRREHPALLSEATEILARFPLPRGEGSSWTPRELLTVSKVPLEFVWPVERALSDLRYFVKDPALLGNASHLEEFEAQLAFMRAYLQEPRPEALTTFLRATLYGEMFVRLRNLVEAHEKYPELVRAHAPQAAWRVEVARVTLRWFPDEESLAAARQTFSSEDSLVHWVVPRVEALAIMEKAEGLASKQDLGSE